MKRVLSLTLSSLFFVSTVQAKTLVSQTMSCYNSNNQYDKFKTYLYQGNQEARRYEGDVYGKQTYLLTHRTIHDDAVSEVYTLLYSNAKPSPDELELKYSLSDYKQNPQSFTVKSSKDSEKLFICSINS